MKKILTLLAASLFLFILVGCNETLKDPNQTDGPSGTPEPEGPTPVEIIEEKYTRLDEATVIQKKVSISSGTLLQYESSTTYTSTGTAYTVTGTEKTLNPLTAETPYTTTEINKTVSKGEFEGSILFDAKYYSSCTVEDGVFDGRVNDTYVTTVLGIGNELSAPVHGMTLRVTTDEKHVTGITISYASAASDVAITLTFTY